MKKYILMFILLTAVCIGAATDYYVTATGAGAKTGLSWAAAMDLTAFETDVEANAEPGDRYFFIQGTYVGPNDIDWSANNGTALLPISVIGVKTGTTAEPPTVSDYAYGDARPYLNFIASTKHIKTSANNIVKNIRYDVNAGTTGLECPGVVIVENCKLQYTGVTASFCATSATGGVIYIGCEIIGGNGRGIHSAGTNFVFNSWIHDSATGVYFDNHSFLIANSVVSGCTVGINAIGYSNCRVLNNTFYNCTIALVGTTAYNTVVINNVFDGCTNVATWATNKPLTNYSNYNIYDNADPNETNWDYGQYDLLSAVTLTDPAATPPDFTVGSGSNVLDAGMQLDGDVWSGILTGDYKVNIGADQDDNAAAGGGGGSIFSSVVK